MEDCKEWRESRESLMSSLQRLKEWIRIDAPEWARTGLLKQVDADIRSPRDYKTFESYYRNLPLGTLGKTAALVCCTSRLQMDVVQTLNKYK